MEPSRFWISVSQKRSRHQGGISPESRSPTFVSGSSLPGVILGTAGYMSPEQAKGHSVDTRSDIWAFGCVLYEMLSGKPAFGGESIVEILSGVLRAELDWTALPEAVPAAIRSLLKRCLQKDRLRRLRHITDARFQIEEVQSAPAAPLPAFRAKPRSQERIWWIGAVAILLIAAATLAVRDRQ